MFNKLNHISNTIWQGVPRILSVLLVCSTTLLAQESFARGIEGSWTYGQYAEEFIRINIFKRGGVVFARGLHAASQHEVALQELSPGKYQTARGNPYVLEIVDDTHIRLSGTAINIKLSNARRVMDIPFGEGGGPYSFDPNDSVDEHKRKLTAFIKSKPELPKESRFGTWWRETKWYREFASAFRAYETKNLAGTRTNDTFLFCFSEYRRFKCSNMAWSVSKALSNAAANNPLFHDQRVEDAIIEVTQKRERILEHRNRINQHALEAESSSWEAVQQIFDWIALDGTEQSFSDSIDEDNTGAIIQDVVCNWGGFVPGVGDGISATCGAVNTLNFISSLQKETYESGVTAVLKLKKKFQRGLSFARRDNLRIWDTTYKLALLYDDALGQLDVIIASGTYEPGKFDKLPLQRDVWLAVGPAALFLTSELSTPVFVSTDKACTPVTGQAIFRTDHTSLKTGLVQGNKMLTDVNDYSQYLRLNWQLRVGTPNNSRVISESAHRNFAKVLAWKDVENWLKQRVYAYAYYTLDWKTLNTQAIKLTGASPRIQVQPLLHTEKPAGLMRISDATNATKFFLDTSKGDPVFGIWKGSDVINNNSQLALGIIMKSCARNFKAHGVRPKI